MRMISAPRYRTVLTYGIFDTICPAQIALLRQLGSLGQDVIVGCATDALCRRTGHAAALPFAQRRHLLERNRHVSRVIVQHCWDQIRTDIVNYNVSALAVAGMPQGHLDDLSDIAHVFHLSDLPDNAAPMMARAS